MTTEKQNGVIIEHGCGKKLFLSQKTLKDICAIVCPGCGAMIGLSLFGSTMKKQLLAACKPLTKKQIAKLLKESQKCKQ